MTNEEILKMVAKWPIDQIIMPDTEPWTSQYDPMSAKINYAFVREFKPKVVLEFGARGGRCTRDINRALIDNQQPFTFKPYELEVFLRELAQANLNKEFGDQAPIVGGDVMEAKDLPQDIDYLFIDNYHDKVTTEWVFDYLLPRHCKPGCLVHFHDMLIFGELGKDFRFDVKEGIPNDDEMGVFYRLHQNGKLPLEKVYFAWEHNTDYEGSSYRGSSSWWTYKPL